MVDVPFTVSTTVLGPTVMVDVGVARSPARPRCRCTSTSRRGPRWSSCRTRRWTAGCRRRRSSTAGGGREVDRVPDTGWPEPLTSSRETRPRGTVVVAFPSPGARRGCRPARGPLAGAVAGHDRVAAGLRVEVRQLRHVGVAGGHLGGPALGARRRGLDGNAADHGSRQRGRGHVVPGTTRARWTRPARRARQRGADGSAVGRRRRRWGLAGDARVVLDGGPRRRGDRVPRPAAIGERPVEELADGRLAGGHGGQDAVGGVTGRRLAAGHRGDGGHGVRDAVGLDPVVDGLGEVAGPHRGRAPVAPPTRCRWPGTSSRCRRRR